MKKVLAFLLSLSAVTAIGACKTMDLGDISQHWNTATTVVTATSKAARPISDEEEYYVGRAVGAKILGATPLVGNRELTLYVNLVGRTVAMSSDKPFTFGGYHFAILDSDQLNAFACPGGTIFITKGLLRATANEDELAAILAHEIAHVNSRDGISAIKSARWTEAVTIIGAQAAKTYSPSQVGQLVGIFEGSVDDVFKAIVVNGFGKSQEYAADETALKYLAKAGYNPNALRDFLKRLAAGGNSSGGGLLATHPGTSDRIENVSAKMPAFTPDQKSFAARSDRFAKIPK